MSWVRLILLSEYQLFRHLAFCQNLIWHNIQLIGGRKVCMFDHIQQVEEILCTGQVSPNLSDISTGLTPAVLTTNQERK